MQTGVGIGAPNIWVRAEEGVMLIGMQDPEVSVPAQSRREKGIRAELLMKTGGAIGATTGSKRWLFTTESEGPVPRAAESSRATTAFG